MFNEWLKKWKRKHRCSKGRHQWHYYTAGRYIETVDYEGLADVPMKECENCEVYGDNIELNYLDSSKNSHQLKVPQSSW